MTILSVQQSNSEKTHKKSFKQKDSTRNVLQYILLILMVVMELIAIVGCVLPFTAKAQQISCRQLPFHFIDGTSIELSDDDSGKYIFVLNKDPQCHSCEETLNQFIQQYSPRDNNVFIVWYGIGNNLQKREKLSEAERNGFRSCQVLFVSQQDMVATNKLFTMEAFPALLLFDNEKGRCEVLSGEQLYVDDYSSSAIREETQKYVRHFLK